MAEWLVSEGERQAAGRGGSVTIAVDDWTPTPPVEPVPYPADAGLAGRVRRLVVDVPAELVDGPAAGTHRLDAGDHLLETTGDGLDLAVGFGAPAQVRLDDEPALCFAEPAPVSVGVREAAPEPETLRVPRSPAGVAAAVTAAGRGLPAGPERSFAPRRPHPPLVAFDDGASVPETDGSGPVFAVPDDLTSVLVAAPLAYYLGARLRVGADRPAVRVPETGFEYPFSRLPALAGEVAAALRRAVHLDRAARQVCGEAVDRGPLARLGLDPESVAAVPAGVRYATFLEADPPALPAWHLSAYVDPSYERARALPGLLDRLAAVYPAEATEMEPSDLLAASLDDFYRGVVSVTPLAPELGVGRSHAWLADGAVVDACKTTPAAYEHARRRRPAGDALDVTVVCNDPAMDAELSAVDAYRDRAAVPVDVTLHEALSTDGLAAALERPHDFFHYVGHCGRDGLRCPDGHLSVADLDRAGPRVFFLNACGSYHEGERLVERGSVAGAVTLERVLDGQATTVGTAFGELVVAGYPVERALSVARGRVMMGRDYAAVGDGTATAAPAVGVRAVLTVDPTDDGPFEVTCDAVVGPGSGRVGLLNDGPREEAADALLSRPELVRLLEGRRLPVVFDGSFRWTDSLAADLRG